MLANQNACQSIAKGNRQKCNPWFDWHISSTTTIYISDLFECLYWEISILWMKIIPKRAINNMKWLSNELNDTLHIIYILLWCTQWALFWNIKYVHFFELARIIYNIHHQMSKHKFSFSLNSKIRSTRYFFIWKPDFSKKFQELFQVFINCILFWSKNRKIFATNENWS